MSEPQPSDELMLRQLLGEITAEKKRRKTPMQEAADTTDFFPEADGNEGVNLLLVNEQRRQRIRAAVENQPPVMQFLIEAAPATIGTAMGSLLGLPGAVGGGVAGEAIGQEMGLTPRSDLGLALSAGGPVAGRGAGIAGKVTAKAAGATTKAIVPVRVAVARNLMRKAVDEFESLGSKIIAKQKGFMGLEPSKLFSIAERAKVRIPAFRITETKKAFGALRQDFKKSSLDQLPEGKRAMKLLDDLDEIFKGSTISFAELVNARQLVGSAVKKAQRVGGQKLGATKLFFKAIADDMDHLASLGGKTGSKGKIAKAAFDRSKLDFAVQDLQAGVANSIKSIPGLPSRRLNVNKFRDWLDDVTNPQSSKYKKNMTEALEDELPGIKRRLTELSEFSDKSPAGPGSLVVRTISAGVGASIGFKIAGPAGAVVGGLAGVRFPEMMVAILSSDPAIKFLKRAITAGDGVISRKAWSIAGQIAAQGVKVSEQNRPSPLIPQGP